MGGGGGERGGFFMLRGGGKGNLRFKDPRAHNWRQNCVHNFSPSAWSGMMWLFLAGLCTSSFFKLLYYCLRSKNVSGKDSSHGSTRLPPIPKVAYPRFQQKQYQHFNMNYSHVQPFR